MSRGIKEILNDVKEAILLQYPAFSAGYAYAKLYEDRGMCVQVESNGELQWVGINDIMGNYFYIRIGADIASEKVPSFSDGVRAIQEVYPCILIAVYKGGDELEIKDALTALLLQAKLRIRKQSVDRVAILAGEFKGLRKGNIERMTSRLKNMTLVRVEFDVLRTFQSETCENYSLCKKC